MRSYKATWSETTLSNEMNFGMNHAPGAGSNRPPHITITNITITTIFVLRNVSTTAPD